MLMQRKNNLANDIGVIITSIFVAILLVRTGTIENLVAQTNGLLFLQSFVAGLFFTSIFTTAPAIVALGSIVQGSSAIWPVAIWGALGALVGDLIIYRFSRDTLTSDIKALVSVHARKRLSHIFQLRLFRWFFALLGGLIIASPLPDELGLFLMGVTRVSKVTFVVVSYIFNFIGIVVIAMLALHI